MEYRGAVNRLVEQPPLPPIRDWREIDPASCRKLWQQALLTWWREFNGTSVDGRARNRVNSMRVGLSWIKGKDGGMICDLAGFDRASVREKAFAVFVGEDGTMTPDQQISKLALISTLNRDECRGWYQTITTGMNGYRRAPFDGEVAALMDRAAWLGIKLGVD